MKSLWIGLVFAAALLLLNACTTTESPTPQPADTLPSSAAPSPAATATHTVTPSPTTTSTLAPINLHPPLVVLADHLPGPDDLLLGPDGIIYLSDVTEGTVKRYTPASGLQPLLSGLDEPEGMLILPDGSLIVAEQGKNRIVRYDPLTKSLTPFFELTNTTGQAGLDGLAWDSVTGTIIVPDSPNGTILRLSPDGRTVTRIASGFTRPTGAWAEPDGSLLIADEYGNALDRLHPDGSIEKLAQLPTPDDVIEDNRGNIFVTTLGDNAVHLLQPASGLDVVLTAGLLQPQGIIFDTSGNLIVTDSLGHRLIELIIH